MSASLIPNQSRSGRVDSSSGSIPALMIENPQTVAITDTSAQSAAINSTVIRVIATSNCFIEFGENPTATSSTHYILANQIEYFGFTEGQLLAVIRESEDGTLYISECA